MTPTPAVVPAPRIVTLQLAYPYKALQPNSSVHWATKAKSKAQYRYAAFVVAREAQNGLERGIGRRPFRSPVTADVEFVCKVDRGRDGDNLGASLKNAWDGIVDSGLLAGDTLDHLSINPPRVALRPEVKQPYVLVTLTEAPL